MKVNNLISFEVNTIHSNKKDRDYYALFACIGNEKFVIAFLTQYQYNNIISLIDKKGE